MIGPFAMAGMFAYFADTSLKTSAGLITFPGNIIQMGQHIIAKADIPYIPGAPFLTAATMAIIAFVTFLVVTNAKDRTVGFSNEDQSQQSQAEPET